MLALKTRFQPSAADGMDATIGLYLGDAQFVVRIAGGQLAINRGDAACTDLILETDQAALLSLLGPDGSVDDALAGGELRLTGDKAVAGRFRGLFPVPESA